MIALLFRSCETGIFSNLHLYQLFIRSIFQDRGDERRFFFLFFIESIFLILRNEEERSAADGASFFNGG